MPFFRKSPILCLAAAIAAYVAMWFLVPRATFLVAVVNALGAARPFVGGAAAAGLSVFALLVIVAPTVAFMLVQISIVYFFAKIRMGFPRGLAVLVLSLAGIAAMVALMVWQTGVMAKIGRYPNFKEVLFIIGRSHGLIKMLYVILVMLGASGIGYLVSMRVTDRNLIPVVAMFAAYIDFWTVTRGPVAKMLARAPEVAAAVSAPIPQAGAGAFMPIVMIGPGDFLFMALIFAAVHRFGMMGARNFWFVFAAMSLGMVAVMLGVVNSLPALVMLAIGVVAANWGRFKLTREEAISTAIVAVLLAASLPIVWSVLR